ncbi:hypothetical protein NQ318_017789, partial [Aromia moschata]
HNLITCLKQQENACARMHIMIPNGITKVLQISNHLPMYFFVEGVTSYSQMLFDVSRISFGGSRDRLYRLSLSKLKLLEYAEWQAPFEKITSCINKGQSEENRRNYKILLTNGRHPCMRH